MQHASLNAAPREPLLAWPGMASLKLTVPLSYLFSKIFLSVYGGTSLLATLHRRFVSGPIDWSKK